MSKLEVYDRVFSQMLLSSIEDFTLFNLTHHQYRPFNCALIMAQRPGARYVMTEAAWNKRGYVLKPEASPIVILQVSGPVALIYDHEDVYSTNRQLTFDNFDLYSPSESTRIDELTYQRWLNCVHRKGIRTAEAKLGEVRYGTAEPLSDPIMVQCTDHSDGRTRTKNIWAYYQITINSSVPSHQKALTLLHELGHLYCGHIAGKHSGEIKLPDYRYADTDRKLSSLNSELHELRNELMEMEAKKAEMSAIESLKSEIKRISDTYKEIVKECEDMQEYEAELVCKILSGRNNFFNDSSDSYLKAHSPDGKLPKINLAAVMDACDNICAMLDI